MPAPKFNAELRTALQKIKLANERLMSPMENTSCETVNALKSIKIDKSNRNTNV